MLCYCVAKTLENQNLTGDCTKADLASYVYHTKNKWVKANTTQIQILKLHRFLHKKLIPLQSQKSNICIHNADLNLHGGTFIAGLRSFCSSPSNLKHIGYLFSLHYCRVWATPVFCLLILNILARRGQARRGCLSHKPTCIKLKPGLSNTKVFL